MATDAHCRLWVRRAAPVALALLVAGCATTAKTKKRRQDRQAKFEEKRAARDRAPRAPRDAAPLRRTPEIMALAGLAEELEANPATIERPCADPQCRQRVMSALFDKLDALDDGERDRVRVLQLGDSHIAADYITRTIRSALQDRFGDAGRGFVAIGQLDQYGGRAKRRRGWVRTRIVDEGQAGKPFGAAGMAIRAVRRGATAEFALVPEDDVVHIHYLAGPQASSFQVFADAEELLRVDARSPTVETRVAEVALPLHALGGVVPPKRLRIIADGAEVTLFGISYESERPGLLYDAIGPVGADARVYLTFEPSSLRASLRALDPDLVVLMIGGNDGLAVRKATRSLDEVRQDHVQLIRALKQHVPDAEILVWAPMDAGERLADGRVVSKRYIEEIRDLQRDAALELGCAFWDTFASMGGKDSFGRWLERRIMNSDLVHPRSKGGDLMGYLFVRAFMNAYLYGAD